MPRIKYIKSYRRKDGTLVSPHIRTTADNTLCITTYSNERRDYRVYKNTQNLYVYRTQNR